jgi:hypothetical protein
MGLNWTRGSLADAQYNWWGSATGPNPPGSGDPVTGNANTSHWLISPFQQERLYTSPKPVSKTYSDIGANFTFDVNIANITDLFGFDIKLTWDNSLITFTHVDYNSTFNALWGSGRWALSNSTNGVGYYRVIVVAEAPATGFTGSHTLFTLTFHIKKGSNIAILQTPIHFEIAKLSNSLWTPIPATVEDGLYQISPNTPGLVLKLVDPDTSKPFVYGKTFDVQVNVTYVSSQLTGFNITIAYGTELFNYTGVTWADSVFGTGLSPVWNPLLGTVTLVKTGGAGYVGANGLLFTLYFQIKFDDRVTHIWRTNAPHDLNGNVSFSNAQLTFVEGTLLKSGIAIGSTLPVTAHLIRGDVNCDGKVNILDLRTVATYYDKKNIQPADPWYKYDLTMDGTIDIFDLVVVASNYGYGP